MDKSCNNLSPNRRSCPLCSRFAPVIMIFLLGALYVPVLSGLFQLLWGDPNNSHGLLVIPISIFLVWRKRKLLGRIEKRAYQPALLIILFGLAALPVALAAEVSFLAELSLLIVIGGLILHIWGKRTFRLLLFPYLFLFFAIPWPSLLIETLTFHLQFIAAKSAALLVGLLGIPIVREGVSIKMGGYTFAVAAPCSGMHYLAALMSLGALTAYLLQGKFYQRAALLLTVPILALIGNALRITTILLIARGWGTEAAEGFYHGFSGLVVFLITFILLLVVGKLFGLSKMREDF